MISGSARGVRLSGVPENVRPTSDRVRESVFNSLGQFFRGGAVLDLYAGTGALGIEALSRGCERAVFVEKDHKNARVIRKNLEAARLLERAEIVVGETKREASRLVGDTGKEFNLIFCDPPYRIARVEVGGIIRVIPDLLAAEGTLVLEADESLEDLVGGAGLRCRVRKYGGTFITRAWKESENEV
ncbi:16S rRNA (guanine(966)-N(2))-methyltransferase RsmD [Rubrobacter indicoceani]|uniref:16S rRNA (guanine(966)-N(2))-methyltransferase RsmD n=1 Tax=Rubrobacter indicoceani TaxID=2051957 RepID=UPI0013C4BA3F|nr:16S rRNA (guanine(966)-N(2))-methyltransferase RsmD [Rubrobacter indicoceani]